MDYKEKYEMALEGIQEILSSGEDSIKMSRLQLRLQGIFPELKKSEDEKVRKTLIKFFKDWHKTKSHCWSVSIPKILAWLENIPYTIDHEKREGFHLGYKAGLEKQGEQKPFDYENADIQQKDFAPKETIKEAESNLTPLERKVKDILFSFHINADDGISFDSTMAIVHNLIILCQQEQKHAWSEEDEKMCQETIDWFEKKCFPYAIENDNPARESIKWLKSIKQKIK